MSNERGHLTEFDDGRPWVGFDFDGTLTQFPYAEGLPCGPDHPKMINVLKTFIDNGVICKIVSARAAIPYLKKGIEMWLADHGLPCLQVTDKKDFMMMALFDDRAITVNPYTGEVETNPDEVSRMMFGLKKE